jgi:hypothetical protein
MKNLLLTLLCGLSFSLESIAQSSSVSSQNEDVVSSYDGITGRFEYPLNASERLNINYTLTPKKPTTVAHLMLHTPDPMPLSAKILDENAQVVLTWTPETKTYLYQTDLNVSSLPIGSYSVHLFMGTEPKSIYHFSFNK